LRKVFFLRRPAGGPSRPAEPWLWIIAGGRPNQVLSSLELRPEPGWPAGFYRAAPALRLRLIVTGELPRTPDTLLLRALGAGKTLREAQRELRSAADHPVARIVTPLMIRLHIALQGNPEHQKDPQNREFLVATRDIYEAWQHKVEAHGRAEGEAHGRAEALLAVLEARGLSVSAEQLATIRGCRDLAQLDAWLRRALSATSSAEVLR
jgi:hypothetical protein